MTATPAEEAPTKWDRFNTRVAEHGRVRAVLESFAYIRPFGGMFGKIVPFYAESYWYALGGLAFLMFLFLTGSGIALALLGPFWWLTNPVGIFLKSFHYWSAEAFFFFMLLHMLRVWATGSFRGRRIFNWWIGIAIFTLAMGENLFGLLARGDWESQFVAMHSDNMLFIQPFFFNLFSPANFTADLAIHIAVVPVAIFALILAHIVLVRQFGMHPPLTSETEKADDNEKVFE
ncbi:cytochrome b N-terminal domain-containing protein [Lacisediminihabitans changchengi]|uniref:Cytochrome bc1 complex cytochrome b subunit n=1 Tax=Lacisediminihabitans changchengi TaxID=2787634 RepID=A0A934SLC5_9MICO|nr:cytochrome b N-terminal domain-containing protein [Lacisediminihabitans changchengi]MBK4348741.1 cytochrome b N-terminal domain-containing protein [Lacisediminihabitans changchengi]